MPQPAGFVLWQLATEQFSVSTDIRHEKGHGIQNPTPNGEATLRAFPEVIAKGKIFNIQGQTMVKTRHNGFVAVIQLVPATKENPGEHGP